MTGLGLLAAVTIAFPRAGMALPNVSQCYVIGTAPRNAETVLVGTNAVPVYRTGGWCAMVPLQPGTNVVTAVCGGESASVMVKVAAPRPRSTNAAPAAEKKYEKLSYAGDVPRPHPSDRKPAEVTVVLDPGHGGAKDLGAISPHGGCEKDINLLLALETRTELEKLGYRVVMTRESDVPLELYGRQKAVYANNADLFVSIHHNAPAFDRNPMDLRYTTVYAWNPLGEALAGAINRRMAKALKGDVRSNGVMHANFVVTRNPEIPSCLVEVDFLTSPAGEEAVWDIARRRRIAASIAAGIADWHAPSGAGARPAPLRLGSPADPVDAQERTWLPLEDVRIGGELRERIVRNMERLAGAEYAPDMVFEKSSTWADWPGDYAGRTILAHVLEARATGIEPKYLAEIVKRAPCVVNALGYCGPILPDAVDEQQLSANGWWLRGLCEYWLWKRDPQAYGLIGRCASNLFARVRGKCASYPLDMAVREQALKGLYPGSISGVIDGWKISSDVGCVFIGLDGFVQACAVLRDPALTEAAVELAGLFRRYDFLKVKAQTHATLAGVRAMIRLYELTGAREYLGDAVRVYDLYLKYGMTENYANYNWFGRPDSWTEPCAVVCSYLAAMQLWRHTGEDRYRDIGERIYWNALCRAQRREGCFSLDSCPGDAAKTEMLAVKTGDVTWGCNMRGGAGLVRAVEYSVAVEGDDTVRLLTPRTLKARVQLNGGEVSFAEETDAPFGGTTRVRILGNTAGEVAFRVRSAPPQRGSWKAGDEIVFTEEVTVDYAVPPIRPENAAGKVRRFRGVLMYGERDGTEVPVYDLFEHSAATDPQNLPFGMPYDRAAVKVLFNR